MRTSRTNDPPPMPAYVIVYVYRGERHQVLNTFGNDEQAQAACEVIREAGFCAWVEEIQPAFAANPHH